MIQIKPIHTIESSLPRLFLAGSIEMGIAEDWQDTLAQKLTAFDIAILNPRRDAWDASWKQEIGNEQFREQVEWELDALAASDFVVFYFDPSTKSPISLLELGLHAESGKLAVICPDGFWRKGNVDIVCQRYNIPQFDSIDDWAEYFSSLIAATD